MNGTSKGLLIRIIVLVGLSSVPTFEPNNVVSAFMTTPTQTIPTARRSASEDPNEPPVAEIKPVIIGGGIAGLATAAALEHISSIPSQILEKQTLESFQNRNAGAGAQLGPNGLRALRAIGGEELMQKCIDSGSVLRGNVLLLPNLPQPMVVPDTAEEDEGLPQIFIRWGVLREILTDRLVTSKVHAGRGGDVRGYEVNGDGTVLLLADGDNPAETDGANLIVSAEGARSIFRHLVDTDTRSIPHDDLQSSVMTGLKDTGRVNIKAVVPRDLDSSFLPGHTYAWFAPDGGVGCFAGPAGSGHTYWAVSIADSVDVETGETERFLAGVDGGDFTAVKSELLGRLEGLDAEDCRFLIDLVGDSAPDTIYVSRSVEAIEVGPSLQKDDKVVLVGDSAHAMPGSYGQNPNFALEDAAVLACCLRDNDSVKSALESYGAQRVSRCLEMQQRSSERAAKAMKGEQVENVSKWIFQWDIH